MDLGLEKTTAVKEPASKRSQKDPDQLQLDKRMNVLLRLIAKSCLQSSQQVRVLKSACLEAMKVPVANNKCLTASKESIQSFLAAAERSQIQR